MILLTTLFNPTSWLLEAIHNFVGNWGWSIIILTILIQFILLSFLLPLKKNFARYKNLKPILITLEEKHKDNSYELNQERNKLFRTEKYNPLFGCIPFLYFPLVYIPLYWGIWSSVNIIGAPWLLWIRDLSTPDPYYILPIIFGLLSFLSKTRQTSTDSTIIIFITKIIFLSILTIASIFLPAGLVLCLVTRRIFGVSYNWIFNSRTSPGETPSPMLP
jgi:YidC/Oxa1 family membrane protein insertase